MTPPGFAPGFGFAAALPAVGPLMHQSEHWVFPLSSFTCMLVVSCLICNSCRRRWRILIDKASHSLTSRPHPSHRHHLLPKTSKHRHQQHCQILRRVADLKWENLNLTQSRYNHAECLPPWEACGPPPPCVFSARTWRARPRCFARSSLPPRHVHQIQHNNSSPLPYAVVPVNLFTPPHGFASRRAAEAAQSGTRPTPTSMPLSVATSATPPGNSPLHPVNNPALTGPSSPSRPPPRP